MTMDPSQAADVYHLLRAFSRGLAHKVRTPLSVISNEISCLALTDKDLLSPKRCREVSDILGAIQLPNDDDFTTLYLSSLLKECNLEPLTADGKIFASVKLLKAAFTLLSIFFPDQKPIISRNSTSLLIIYELTNEKLRSTYHSLTEYYCDILGMDSYAPPLIDVIFFYHAATVTIQSSPEALLTIEVPLK